MAASPHTPGEWEAAGQRARVDRATEVWFARFDADEPQADPLLVLHGFPTCSYDWHTVLPTLRRRRDVIVLDFPGFGLSSKPDVRYGIRRAADAATAVLAVLDIARIDIVSHDMGDTVAGELLARDLDGELGVAIGGRVLTNGSIYLDMAVLTDGQHLLLGLPDERNDLVGADGGAALARSVAATFAAGSPVDEGEMRTLAALAARDGGLGLLPRTIRYIEDRRAEERRFTGAIEAHPSSVGVVWGALDPVAVLDMAHRFVAARPDAPLTVLDGVGHYPMIEAPDRFAAAVTAVLDAR